MSKTGAHAIHPCTSARRSSCVIRPGDAQFRPHTATRKSVCHRASDLSLVEQSIHHPANRRRHRHRTARSDVIVVQRLTCLQGGNCRRVLGVKTFPSPKYSEKNSRTHVEVNRRLYGKYSDTTTFVSIFTALHVCRAVFPIAMVSVRPSVCHSVNCDKKNESSAEILIPHER